jgi:hypothetical protein
MRMVCTNVTYFLARAALGSGRPRLDRKIALRAIRELRWRRRLWPAPRLSVTLIGHKMALVVNTVGRGTQATSASAQAQENDP